MAGKRGMQLARVMRLLRELEKHPRGCHYDELARNFGFSARTTYRDLSALRDAGWPVEKAGRQGFWKIGGGAVPGILFTPAELTALALARQMLTGMPGSPFDAPMRRAFQKIMSACDRDGLKALEASDRRMFAVFRRSRPYTRSEIWFAAILDALNRSRTLRISYYTRERDEESLREVDPYGLVLHEGAFYLVGHCHKRHETRTFLVDRIRSAQPTGAVFAPPADFSAEAHLRNAWGILKGRMLVTVRARFDRTVAPVIREGRWHQSQKLADGPNGSVILSVQVAGWEEIRRWLLGFGGAVEVLEPGELRESVAGEARKMGGIYGRGARRLRG